MKAFLSFVILISFLVSCQNKSSEQASEPIKTDTILQKNGQVLSYTVFDKQLFKMKRDRSVYSNAYQKRIAKLVEYYLDKNNQTGVQFQHKNPEAKLGYSVEETDWEGVVYTQIGLFTMGKTNMKTFQWLFYNAKTQELYEFDVPKNTPILFKYQ
ncbi:hypothetical protein [Cloacibacterium caeni]|uniref:hypothetical protein n=1 Tax=Cloacibacterium caeni TaxID=2004710 RepID=UPI001BCC623E|nr:hypothetical protein [Cloacibacterium caeni]